MFDTITGWFEITQYNHSKDIIIKTLLKPLGCTDTRGQPKSCMTPDQNSLLVGLNFLDTRIIF